MYKRANRAADQRAHYISPKFVMEPRNSNVTPSKADCDDAGSKISRGIETSWCDRAYRDRGRYIERRRKFRNEVWKQGMTKEERIPMQKRRRGREGRVCLHYPSKRSRLWVWVQWQMAPILDFGPYDWEGASQQRWWRQEILIWKIPVWISKKILG